MIHSALITNDWSAWFDIHNKTIINSLPDKPGIYEIRTNFQINRLKGASELVYMGSASDSLKKRLCSKLFGSFTGLDRASKWLLSHSHVLEFRYMTTQSEKEAKYFEGLLLWEYENRHWEIPPGNDKLEKKAVLATIEPGPKTSTENMLKDFITQDKTNKEISAAFGVPEYIIENLRVYFLL